MEGPGVHVIKERLSFLKGKIVINATGNTKEKKDLLIGKRVIDIKAVGKKLYIEFEDLYLIIHFLMYGSFRINERKEGLKERLSLIFEDFTINFYNCSVKIKDKSSIKIDTSIDVLSEDFNVEKVLEEIKNYNGYICDILLDQNVFGGVGNIIKNEALFRARVHPLSISKNLDDKTAKTLIKEVIKFSKIFYKRRKENKRLKPYLLIYGRKKCLSCGSIIKLKYLGKTKRKTYYCENCQKIF